MPRDYDEPDGPEIEVALFRVPAASSEDRIGSLLVNPGGPGPSGVEFAREFAGELPAEIRDRFDVVGFDPRGTGETIPVDCTDTLDPLLDLDYSPDSKDERDALAAAGRDFADACEERHGDDLAGVDSRDTVRDMDRIRAAVGDEGLTYLGFSYGTYLGALYADMFPKRVRALVLDGPLDPSLNSEELAKQQAVGFDDALDLFFDDCGNDPSCAFYSDGDPATAFDEVSAAVEADPIPGAGGRTLSPNEFTFGVATALYLGEDGYEVLANALARAARGDSSGLLGLFDAYTDRNSDGTYSDVLEAYYAIICVDRPPIPARAYRGLEKEFASAAPHFGLPLLYELRTCAEWPADSGPTPKAVRAKGADPILVVASTGDPATPYKGGKALASQLDSGVLLTVESATHTSFGDDECATEVAAAYLLDPTSIEGETRCG
ncbi:MAG TPA: alpha/beta hydrolase [Acidimicrobiia bacterium]|nr:alpha/beta hydrolase [Acidimicrobiia bacterium]